MYLMAGVMVHASNPSKKQVGLCEFLVSLVCIVRSCIKNGNRAGKFS